MAPQQYERHRLPTDDSDDYSSDSGGGGGGGGGGRGRHDGGAAAARALGLPGPERRARPNILITGTPGTGKSTLAEAIVALCGGVPMAAGGSAGGASQEQQQQQQQQQQQPPLPLLAPLPPICVGDRVKAEGLHSGYDERMSAFLLDEDKVVDALEREVAGPGDDDDDDGDEDDNSAGGSGGGGGAGAATGRPAFLGGRVVEHHGSNFFPARWFDLVLVTRCSDTAVLWARLERRGGASGGGGNGGGGGGGYTEEKIRENVQAEMMGVCAEEAHEAWRGVPHCALAEVASDAPEDIEAAARRVAAWLSRWRRPAAATGGGAEAVVVPPFPAAE